MKRFFFKIRMKRKIREADEMRRLTGRRYLVLRVGNRLVVKSKQELKYLIRIGVFKASIQELEQVALYITN